MFLEKCQSVEIGNLEVKEPVAVGKFAEFLVTGDIE
jgi:hypothetical protein